MNTTICCHRTHSFKFDGNANAGIQFEQGFRDLSVTHTGIGSSPTNT